MSSITYADAARIAQAAIAERRGVEPEAIETEPGFEDADDFLVPYHDAGVDPALVFATQDDAALVRKADGAFHEEPFLPNLDRFDSMTEVEL